MPPDPPASADQPLKRKPGRPLGSKTKRPPGWQEPLDPKPPGAPAAARPGPRGPRGRKPGGGGPSQWRSPAFRAASGKQAAGGMIAASNAPCAADLPEAAGPGAAVPPLTPYSHVPRAADDAGGPRRAFGREHELHQLAAAGDKYAQRALDDSLDYAETRRTELCALHGGALSAGVNALIEDEALIRGRGRYWLARASHESNGSYDKLGASLLGKARATVRDTWVIAALEERGRRLGELPGGAPWEAAASGAGGTSAPGGALSGAEREGGPASDEDAERAPDTARSRESSEPSSGEGRGP